MPLQCECRNRINAMRLVMQTQDGDGTLGSVYRGLLRFGHIEV